MEEVNCYIWATVRLIATKFGMMIVNDPIYSVSHCNVKFLVIQDGRQPPFDDH